MHHVDLSYLAPGVFSRVYMSFSGTELESTVIAGSIKNALLFLLLRHSLKVNAARENPFPE